MSIEAIQRAVVRHITRARNALRQATLDDDTVHDARKDLKRARSGLRLLRPLDEAAYRRENLRLRDAARRLSPVRDHKVLLARLTGLLAEEKQPARRRLLLSLRKDLYNARRRDWRALHNAERMHSLEETLGAAAQRVRDWPVPQRADGAPESAVRSLYRKGRKALKRSKEQPSDEHLHEARKQAKHLRQALEILAGDKPPRKAQRVLARAEDVGDWLGDDHDLAVVESRFIAAGGAAKPKRELRSALEKRRARLQKKALKAARKLFRKKTRRVLRRAALRSTS